MAIRDGHIDEQELRRMVSYGDDTPSLMSRVPEPPPSHWGKITSKSRTLSASYVKFLERKEDKK